MKKLQVITKGKTEIFNELLYSEVEDYISKIDSCIISFNPRIILTYRINDTNYFFRDKLIMGRLKKYFRVTSKKSKNSDKEKFKIINENNSH